MVFEICANSLESCLAAQQGGAQRVELCAGISEGGTTPSLGEIVITRNLLDIKLHVIIRPRGGDFLYSQDEKEIMLADIVMARKARVDGLVFGCLNKDGEIDIEFTKELIDTAEGLPITFHRAFDQCRDPFKALEQLIELGCNRILTSGQQPTAEQGIPLLKKLIKQANNRIIIIPGSGINENNIRLIAEETGAKELHFSAREPRKSEMHYYNPNIYMGTSPQDEYTLNVTTAERVRRTIEQLSI
jgi:Uncharacterized protein involved in copper resistance